MIQTHKLTQDSNLRERQIFSKEVYCWLITAFVLQEKSKDFDFAHLVLLISFLDFFFSQWLKHCNSIGIDNDEICCFFSGNIWHSLTGQLAVSWNLGNLLLKTVFQKIRILKSTIITLCNNDENFLLNF